MGNWLQIALAWANNYIAEYPHWKIYEGKVGSNLIAQSPAIITDTQTSFLDLKKQLSLIQTPGHYILHLKKDPKAQAGNMEHKFEVSYQYTPMNNALAIPEIGSTSSPALPPGTYMTIDQHKQSLIDLKKEWDREQLIKEQADKIRKLEKAKAEPAPMSIDKMVELAQALPGAIGAIKQLLAGSQQMAHVGYVKGTHLPADSLGSDTNPQQDPAAAQQKTTVPDQQSQPDPEGWDELDQRILNVQTVLLRQFGITEQNPDQPRIELAELLEGVSGLIKTNPDLFKSTSPVIKSYTKFYTND